MKIYTLLCYDLDSYYALNANGDLKGGTTLQLEDLPVEKDKNLFMAAVKLLSKEAYEDLLNNKVAPFYVRTENIIYGPSLVQKDREIGFNLGTNFYPLSIKGSMVDVESATVEWSIHEGRAYGYPAKIFKAEILKDETLINMEMLLRLEDFKDRRNPQELKSLIKIGDFSFLANPPSSNSSNYTKTYPARVLEPGSYQVSDVKRVTKKDGSDMFVLSIETKGGSYTPVKDDRTVDLSYLVSCPDTMKIYAPKDVEKTLSLYGDSINTSDFDWMFTMLSKESGKKAGTVRASYQLTTDQPYVDNNKEDDSDLLSLLGL